MTREIASKLVMIDGPDGVGKTTQIELLRQSLEEQQYKVATTRIHGGTPIGEWLRALSVDPSIPRSPRTDFFLTLAIHAELAMAMPKIKAEADIVLMDRSPLSLWAYQVRGEQQNPDQYKAFIEEDIEAFNPDLMLVYAASMRVLRKRLEPRTSEMSIFEKKASESSSYMSRTTSGFVEAAGIFGAHIINASGGQADIHEATKQYVTENVLTD
jgi:dTMP kinase